MRSLLLLFLSIPLFANSQNYYQVYGTVNDSLSGEKIIGCTISEKDGPVLAATTNTGDFNLKLPAGKHVLVFSAVGFEKKLVEINLTQNLELHPELFFVKTIGEAVITAEKAENIAETTRIGSISIPVQSIKKVPAMFGESDVLKVLQLLPGVKPGMEGTSGLYVRGGSPDQNLILLDGTPLYNVSHLYGFFSVFNTDALNHVELIKGGFPARYGGRLSSVLELTLKDGNMRKWKGSANLGIVSSSITLEGPIIRNKVSLIVSARRTYLDAIAQPIIRASSRNPYAKQGYFFYDLNGKLNIRPTKKDQILISVYSGDDKFYNNVKPYEFLYDGVKYTNESRDELGWGNRLAAIKWNHRINASTTSTLIANYTRYRYKVFQMSNSSEYNDTAVVTTRYDRDFRSEVKDYGVKWELDYKPGNKSVWKTGLSSIYHTFAPGATVYNYQDDQAQKKFDSTLGSSKVTAFENYAFLENDMIINARWKANYGLHYSQFLVQGKLYHSLQPRISARYLLGRDYAFKFAYARMQQYIHLLTNSTIGLPTDLWVPSVKQLEPEKSHQINVGFAKTYFQRYLVTLEGYYKTMNGVLDYKNGASFYNSNQEWFEKVEAGKGTSYGIEFFIQRKVGKLTGWLAYTWSKTDRKFPTINFGEKFPYKYDSRHNASVVVSYDINKKHTVGATWVFSTGNAFTLANTQILGIDQNGNLIQTTTMDKRNQFRGADYHRLDLMYTWHIPKKWGEIGINAGLYNSYSRRNPFYYNFSVDNFGNKVLVRTSLFPVIPFLSFNINFR